MSAHEAHAALSATSLRFLEAALASPELCDRRQFERLDRENPIPGYTFQPWPLFAAAPKLAELGRVAAGIARLIKSLPARLFGNDPARLLRFYGTTDAETLALVLLEPNGIAAAPMRGDYVDAASGLQCLEVNVGSWLGGWQMELLEEQYLGCPPLAGFLAEHGVAARHRRTIRGLFGHMIRETLRARLWQEGDLNCALIFWPGTPEAWFPLGSPVFQREYEAALAEHSLTGRVLLCRASDLEIQGGRLRRGGVPIHFVFEQQEEWTDRTIFRAFKSRQVNLFTGPAGWFLSDKRNLALLSERGGSDDFSAEERELIARHVPWTRVMEDAPAVWRGERAGLPQLAVEQRERLVLKPAQSFGGKGVHVGWQTAPDEWERLVREALSGPPWIVQEWVESLPYVHLSKAGEPVPHDVVWGIFTFGDEYGGTFLRLAPKGRGVVNVAQQAEVGYLLEVEEVEPPVL